MLGNYIDIHNHILPGVDDGSKDMEETIEIIKLAMEQGITTMIATPHYVCGGKNTEVARLEELQEQVQKEASKLHPEFRIFLGEELMYSDSLLEHVKEKKAITLAGSRYVLIEFSIGITYESMYRGMKRFITAGYAPIIAHVERYECVKKNTGRIMELIELGCYIQMNSSSLLGGIMNMEARYHRKLVTDGYVHLIASDSHDKKNRVPCMKTVVDTLGSKLEDRRMQDIFLHNPNKILENKYI